MNLTTYLREPYHILSSEECKGAYVRNHKGEYSIHMMTSTSIQAKGEGMQSIGEINLKFATDFNRLY